METLSAVSGWRFGNSSVADAGDDVTIASVWPSGLRNCSVTVSPVSCQSKLPYALRCCAVLIVVLDGEAARGSAARLRRDAKSRAFVRGRPLRLDGRATRHQCDDRCRMHEQRRATRRRGRTNGKCASKIVYLKTF